MCSNRVSCVLVRRAAHVVSEWQYPGESLFYESGNLSVPSLSTTTVTTPSRTLLRFKRFTGEVVGKFWNVAVQPTCVRTRFALSLHCAALRHVRALHDVPWNATEYTKKFQGVPRNASTYPKETNIITSGQNKPNNTPRSTNRQDTSKKTAKQNPTKPKSKGATQNKKSPKKKKLHQKASKRTQTITRTWITLFVFSLCSFVSRGSLDYVGPCGSCSVLSSR